MNRVLIPLAGGRSGGRGGQGSGAGGRGGETATAPLAVGEYMVTVELGGEKLTKVATVRARIQ